MPSDSLKSSRNDNARTPVRDMYICYFFGTGYIIEINSARKVYMMYIFLLQAFIWLVHGLSLFVTLFPSNPEIGFFTVFPGQHSISSNLSKLQSCPSFPSIIPLLPRVAFILWFYAPLQWFY